MSVTQTGLSWANFFTLEDFVQNRLPGLKDKQIIDNWTIIIGANDRSNLLGPNLTLNIGASYSTSYDLAGFLVNSYLPAGSGVKTLFKLLLGSGDIKLAFGPSTALLYGGPGGSSKRGPYWERIAGTWWNPRGKGAKYSAEGSFTPQAIGKGGAEGLQFFERDQIFGEENQDGYNLAIMLKKGKKSFTHTVKSLKDLKENIAGNTHRLEINEEEPKLPKDFKEDKYESDLAKCYTAEEMKILEAGDKAAKLGLILLALLDLAANLFGVLYAKLKTQAGVFTSLDAMVKDRRDLDQTRTIMIVRLAYKTAKVLGLQLIEIFENTERLARAAIECKDSMDVYPKDYFINEYLKAEKRKATEGLLQATNAQIKKEIEDRFGLTKKQIADLAAKMIEDGEKAKEFKF